MTATFPCTITGMRWDLSCLSLHAGADRLFWAIVVVRDGETANPIVFTDSNDLYQPEQNVLTYGMKELSGNTTGEGYSKDWEGTSKSMRKLMGGDSIEFVTNGVVAANKVITGAVQFFCKT